MRARLVFALILLALVVLFMLLNTQPVELNPFFEVDEQNGDTGGISLALVILLSYILGGLTAGALLRFLARSLPRRDDRDAGR